MVGVDSRSLDSARQRVGDVRALLVLHVMHELNGG